MRKKFRKTLSFFLAFLMLLTSINAGLTALAADLDEDDSAATEETTALDESYDALIEAMEDSYVTSAEYVYDAEAQSVTVADNDEAAIQTAAQAFYAVLTQLDYTESDIASLAAEICETLAAEMEDAFTDDMQSVITKYFTGLGDSESVDNEDEYTFTVEITPNARVAEYTSVDELPDVLPSSETFTYVHEGFSVLLISSYSLASVSDSLAEEEAEEEAEDADEAEDVDADVDVEETADEAVDETADEENAQAETPAEDTEFPAALKAYAQYFSAEALAVDYSELSADELLALCGSGQAAIDAVQQISAEKQAEFYETAVEDAQAYLDGALAYSVSAFKSAVAEAAALVQGRAYDSFTLDELAAVEELTAGAAAAYEVYTDSQKAAVASEYAVLQSVQALYDEAFAYASKLAYMEAVAALQEAETGSAEGTAEPVEDTTQPAESTTQPAESTTEPAESTTEPAESTTEPAESTTEPAQTEDGETGETGTALSADELQALIDAAEEAYANTDPTDSDIKALRELQEALNEQYGVTITQELKKQYYEYIDTLASLIAGGTLSVVDGYSVTDNASQDVLKAANAFYKAAAFLNVSDSETYANIKQITKQIKADVEEAMGSDAYSAANAANIVTYLSGGRPSDAQSDVTFTVTPDYLAAYTSVSQIPETIEYAVVTFTYAHTYSNGYILTSFDKTSETLTDADTYTIFNTFMSVFSAENLALDVSALDIDVVSALITDVRASLAGVEAYSDSVLDTLLGDMLAEAYALEKELDIYLVEYYCNTVVALYEKWANTAYNSDVAAQYAADCAAAEEIYALISDEYKESEAITAALQIYAQVSDTMNYLMAIQTANEIIDIAHSLYEKYSGRTIDDALCAEWDADYAEYYNLAMAYFTDTSDCQWYAEVTQIVTSDEIVSGAFNDLYTEIAAYESEMEAAEKDAESATLNSALSTSSATAEAGVLSQLLNAVLGDGITALAGITESEATSWVETNISYPNTEDINQEYTDDEWADYVAGLITKIDELISSGYIETLLGTSLSDTVEGLLGKNGSIWTDSLLNTLIEVLAIEIENAVSDYDTLINLSGYTLYYHVDEMINQNSQIKAYISSNYPEAYAALNNSYTGSTSWTDFNNAYGIANLYWGIEDSSNPLETFIDAFRAIFSGYWLLLMALFSGDSVTFAGVTIVSGADGYNDYILPFMEALGIDSSTASDWTSGTTTYYTKASTIDSLYSWSQINTLLRSIIYPLIDRVANILDGDMLTEILGILPNLAYMIDNNILADGLNSLATIKLITGDIEILGLVNLTINEKEVTIYDVITTDGINDLLSTALLSIIEETDDDGNVTASYGVSLPAITWSNLSHTGTPTLRSSYTTAGSCYTIVADTDKVFLELLYYVAKTLIANEQNIIDLLNYLLGTDSSTSTDSDSTSLTDVFTPELIVQALCSQSAETIVNALLLIFIPYYSSDHDWGKDIDFLEVADYYYSQTTETSTSWVDGTMDATTWYDDETGNYYTYPTYTDDDGNTATITDEDITYVIETLTSIVTNLIEYLAGASIEGLLEEALYNGDIVSSLFTTVYSLFDNETITNLLGFINVTNIYDETTSVDVSKSAVVSNLQSYGFYDVAAKVNAIDASSGHVHTDDCYETTTDADGNTTTTLTCGYVTGYADLEITAEDWDIETADDFENAIYAMLEPFASVLAFLTAGQSLTLDVMGIFEFYGSNWYSNALYPIYNALGVTNTGALAPSAYNAQVTNDYSNAAYYLIHPLIEFFEEMSDDPINFGLNALGNISMLIDNDGIQEIIEQVLRPLTNIARALLKFVSPDEITAIYTSAEYAAGTVDDSEYWQYLLEWVMDVLNEIIDENLLGGTYDADADKSWYLNWADLEDQLIPLVNEILPELLSGLSLGTTTDDAGNEVDITISLEIEEIDWKKWAGCGTLSSSNLNSHVTDIPQLACELLKFIWRFIDGNEDAVYTLLEALITDADTVATIETYAAKLFAISDDDFVILLVDLVNALDASTYSVDWSFLYTNYQETTVTYPYDNDGTVTQSDIEQLISVVSGAVSGVLQLLLEDYGGLAGYVETSLFTDSLLTTLASTIYSLFDNDTVTLLLGALQVDGSMETIYADLVDRGYSDIAALIKEQIDLTEAAADDPNATAGSYSAISTATAWNWGVDELVDSGADLSEIRDAFTQALVTILSPFNSVLKYLLAAGTVSVGGAVDFTGALGYANAIKPLLDALGCDTCSTSRYILDVEDDEDALLLDIINPLLDLAESIMEDPINTALDILPSVANFLYQGGVQTAVEALLYPLLNFADPITSILFDGSVFDLLLDLIGFQTFLDSISDDENVHGHTDDCYDSEGTLTCTIEEYHQYTWENLQEAIIPIVKYFLDDIVISEADGVTIYISLADITLGDLAGCGYVSNKLIAAEQEDEVVLVLRWVWDTVLANEDTVYTLLDYYLDDDTYSTLVTYIDRLFDQTGDDIIVMLVELIKGLDDSDFTQDWSFLEDAVKTFVDYPYYSDGTQVTPTAVQSFIDNLSAILNIVIGELLTDYDSLNAFVSGSLYTDELITTITSALYGLLENSTVVAILGVFGIDVSLDGLMSTLDDAGYSKVTALIDTTHTHTVDGGCYNLTCTTEEHTHTADCYETTTDADGTEVQTLTCTKEEHTHSVDGGCYELVCTTATCFGEVATETAWEFGVTDSESFIDALTTVLSPLNSLLAIFLNAGTVSLTVDGEELVSLTGANGYANAILPLLEALGCTAEDGLLTADEYAAAVAKDSNALLSSVLTPLLALVERILNDPLGEALEIIPTIANFINQGGVQTAVEALIHPVSNLISPILYVLTGSEDDTIISFVLDLLGVDLDWDNLQNSIIPLVNSLLSDITIAENTTDPNCGLEEGAEHTHTAECYTVSISLSLNNINWAELAGCFAVEPDVSGIYTDTNGYYFDDNDEHGAAGATYSKTATYDSLQCDVLILLLRYVWNQVLINEDAVTTLLETLITDEDTLSTIKLYLQNVFLLSSDEFIVLLIGLLADYDDSDYNTAVDWTFLYTGLTESTLAGEESGAYTVEDVTGVVNTVSALVTTVIELLLSSYGGLSGYVETNLYTDSLATTLAALIFGLFDNSVVQTVLSLLSVSVDLESIYDVLNDAGYSDIAALVKAQIDLNNDGDDSTSGSLSAIFTEDADGNTVALDWGIDAAADARDAFTEALVTILSPFNSVLSVLLNTGTISIADAIDFTGADGYANAILPLLTALGCTTALSAEDYAAAAEKDSNNLLLNILNPILDLADTIMADPVGALVDILPSVFNFIDKGGVQYCIESLLHPILDYLDPILTILTKGTDTDNLVDFVIDLLPLFVSTTNDDGSTNTTLETVFTLLDQYGWGDIQNAIVPMLNTLLGNLSINDEISFSVTIPELDWAMFGGAVADTATDDTKKAGTEFVFANSDEETVTATTTETLLTYVWNTVLVNAQTIAELLEYFIGEDTYETLAVYIEKLFALSADDVIGLLIDVLGGFDASDYVADWSFLYENYSEASVTYPDGVTSSDIDNLIAVLSSAIEGVLALLLDADLTELVAENLYTDDIVTTLASAIYSLFDNDTVVSVLAILGVDVSTDGIAATLKSAGYSKVASLISNADSFSDISTDSAWSWGVTDSASFAAAIEAILSPFNSVLDYLFGAGTINIADVLSLTGADGYNNAVKPLLEALGCTTVGYDSSNPLDSILTPLLNLVDEVLADPLGGVLDIVPSVANFIDQGGVQYFVESLLYPITSIADPLLFLISEDESVGLFDFVMELVASLLDVDLSWDNLQNEIIPLINTLLTDVEISGTTVSIAIPEIDWAALAGCGTATEGDYFISAEAADEVITVLRYVWNAVIVNEDAVDTLLESLIDSDTYETISPYLGIVFDLTADEIITVLVEMLAGFDDSDYTVDWSFLYENYATTAVTYPDGVTSTDITNLVSTISGLLEGVLDMLLDADLTELVAENVYTDDIITTLASAIYSLFDNETVVTVLGILGIDVSQDAVAKALKSAGYTKVASSISKASSYADADTSKWTWGVTDKESFAEALVAVLAPFNDVLGYFLNAGTIEILGIELTGANGYANAIKPLLDALGCDTLTESQYAAAANKDSSNLLLNIINPLLELVDEILADPVNGVVSILPSIANFMNQDGVQTAVEALLHPILNIVNPLFNLIIEKLGKDETTLFDFLFDLLGVNLTWDTLQDDIIPLVNDLLLQDITINDTVVTLRIPEIDWAVLAGCGKATTGDYFITAAAASTDLTVLRYIWRAVEENEGYLKVIISSLVGEDTYSTLSPYIMQLLDLTDDEFITKLVAIVNALDDSDYTVDWSFLYEDYTKKSVSYPDGVTSSDLKNLVSVLANAVNGVVEMLLDADLTELVAENVYTDDIITTLASAIYSLFDNDTVVTVLGILGIDVSKSAIVKSLKSAGYTKVASSIKKASSFAEADTSKWTWGVTDRESFAEALVAVLAPFNDVLGYFLNAGTIEIMGVEFTGANGYANAIKPLLDALGCDTLSESKYAAAAKKDSSNLLLNIINPLLDLVDEVLADPVNAVVDILPSVANFINQNGIQTAIEALLHPILNIADPILSIFTDDNVVDFILNLLGVSLDWDTIQNDIIPFVNKYLKNIEIGGVTVTLTIPNISWAKLAGCGKATDGDYFITGSTAKTAVTLLRYVWKAVETNEKAILKLVKGLAGSSTYKTLKPYLTALLDLTDDEVIKLLVDVVNAMDASDFKADWSFLYDNYKKTSVTYPDGVTSSDMNKLVSVLSSLVSGILELVLDADLTELVAENVYTDDIITTLASTIYSLFDNDTVVTVLGILGVDVSQSAVAKSLKSAGYTKVASSIKKASSFSAADTSKWSWGVTDKESFAEALVAILSPFNDVLGYFLNSGTIDISGIVTLTGANGYKNAIKPLLDALGCDTLSASKYAAAANKDSNNLLLNIINPLLDLVDEVLADPVNAVVDILPSVANFINQGGVQYFVECLLQPILGIANPVLAIFTDDSVFDFLFELLGVDFTWDNIQNEIIPFANTYLKNLDISGTTVTFKIPTITWGKLAGCGKATDGDYFITGSTAKTAVTLLRYIWKAVETNEKAIMKLVKGLAGSSTYKTLKPYLTKLFDLTDDEFIKVLVDVVNAMDASDYSESWSFLYKNYSTTSVTYPDGVTSSDLSEVVSILSEAVNNAIEIFLDGSLADLVGDTLYKDSIVTTLASTIFSLFDNSTVATVLGILGIDVSQASVAKLLKSAGYTDVANSIKKASSFSAADTSKWSWGVTDRASFAEALVAVLSPFNGVLGYFLNAGSIDVLGITLTGANGYANAIKPLLDALGCDTLSASQYAAAANKDSNNLLLNIINPLLDLVDEILSSPVSKIAEILPSAANFIDKGGVQTAVEALLQPILGIVDPILTIFTDDGIFDFLFDLLGVDLSWGNIQNEVVGLLNSALLSDLTIGSTTLSLTLPEIDWGKLAGCGTLNGKKIEANTGKELLVLLRYVFKVLEQNKNTIFDLVGGKSSTIGTIINNVINVGADGLATIVVNILLKLETYEDSTWTFKSITEMVTTYTENMTEEDYANYLSQIDDLIIGLLKDLMGADSLLELVGNLVYTNDIINTLAELIYPNIEGLSDTLGFDINKIFAVLDIDISTTAFAKTVSDFSAASAAIAKCSSWADVDFDSLDWGVTTGDRTSFVNALTAILRPFFPVLQAILSGDDLVVLGSIEIAGGNGYNTAVIPLLEAFGVDADSLTSVAEYTANSGTDTVFTAIINPLLDKVEELLEAPIMTLCEMLPNVAYFLYNNHLSAVARNLLMPVTNILEEIDPIYSIDLEQYLSLLDDLDLASLVNSLIGSLEINGTALNIQITDIDLATLAGRGTLVSYTSARTYNSSRMTCKMIDADTTAVFISVFRYLIENLKANLDAITALLAMFELSDSVLDIVNTILEALVSMDVDSVIEMLLDLLFGSSDGSTAEEEEDAATSTPFNLGNYYWVYWLIFALVVILLFFLLLLIFKDDDDDEEEEDEAPNGDGGGSPPPAAGTAAENTDSAAGTEGANQ